MSHRRYYPITATLGRQEQQAVEQLVQLLHCSRAAVVRYAIRALAETWGLEDGDGVLTKSIAETTRPR